MRVPVCVLCGELMQYEGVEHRELEDSNGGPVEYDLFVCRSGKGRCADTDDGKPGTRRLEPRHADRA